jgi:hypothetical protein
MSVFVRRDRHAERDDPRVADELETKIAQLASAHPTDKYSAVKVLLLNWKDSNLNPGVHKETIELQRIFREKYNFMAGSEEHIFRIPSKNSQAELEA